MGIQALAKPAEQHDGHIEKTLAAARELVEGCGTAWATAPGPVKWLIKETPLRAQLHPPRRELKAGTQAPIDMVLRPTVCSPQTEPRQTKELAPEGRSVISGATSPSTVYLVNGLGERIAVELSGAVPASHRKDDEGTGVQPGPFVV